MVRMASSLLIKEIYISNSDGSSISIGLISFPLGRGLGIPSCLGLPLGRG